MVRTSRRTGRGGEGGGAIQFIVPEAGWNMEGSKLFPFRSQKQWK